MSPSPSEIKGFQGLHVVSFESRRGALMADLIAQHGGRATVAPAMREVPFTENSEALDFGRRVLENQIDAVVFMTGTGVETLFHVLETQNDRAQWVTAFSKLKLISRGPKPAEALARLGLTGSHVVAEPATWKEVVATLERDHWVRGKTIAVQEYGVPNPELIEALSHAGARIVRVPLYRWALPENREPLRQALKTVIGGQADVVLFTNSNQINNVIRLAQEEGLEESLREALSHTVVASVGPVCTHFLDEYGVPVDLQPEQPKMNDLVHEASERGAAILKKKRKTDAFTPLRIYETSDEKDMASLSKRVNADTSLLQNSPFMKACRREATPHTPIWLMRQAGRYMKEYRDIRERHSFLDLCKDSDLACEVSVYAAERLGVDAAIIFSDILLILEPMGLQLEYAKGEGPVIHNPIRNAADVERVRAMTHPEPLDFVYQAIRKTRQALPPTIPLIGFCGAPFTLASYMIEGQGSRNFIRTKSLMYTDARAWHALMTKITDGLIVYLQAQVAAGAQVVQLFDSWVGCLSPDDYRTYVLAHSQRLIQAVQQVPVIHFGTQTGTFLELLREAGGDVIGIDWRVTLDSAWARLGDVAIQGNLDPVVLFSDLSEIRRQAQTILDLAAGRPGHIFNLGHGVLPQTPVGHVKALVDYVHDASAKAKSA